MKKLTSLSLIIMMMIFTGIISTAQARTGSTSDSSSSSKSRSTISKTTTSKPSKTTSATNSIFANAAKNNEASKAWQKINKKPVDNTPVAVAPVPAPVQNNDNTNRQLADIQRQLAENRRQQQIADAARIAAEMALRNNNNRPQPAYITPSTVTTPPVANVTNTDTAPAKSGGTSWFMIFLIIGGIVVIYFWLKNRNSSSTNYRL